MKISDGVVVVLGGASGLGAATARHLAGSAAMVAVMDLDTERGTAVAESLGANGCFEHVDIVDARATREAMARVAEHAPLRVVVNCAGIGRPRRLLGRDGAPMPTDYWHSVVSVSLTGSFHALLYGAEQMAKASPANDDGARGVIINTASVAAFDGQAGQVPYSAAKAGIVGMTLPAGRDLAPLGIRVCTIAPGMFDTPILAALDARAQTAIRSMSLFPSRVGDPLEFARLVEHVIDNDMLNAEVIRLDAGMRLAPNAR